MKPLKLLAAIVVAVRCSCFAAIVVAVMSTPDNAVDYFCSSLTFRMLLVALWLVQGRFGGTAMDVADCVPRADRVPGTTPN